MTTIRHAIKINAPRARVFQALTDPGQIAGWHIGPVDGEVAVGSIVRMEVRPGLSFAWKTTELVDGERLHQDAVDGPGHTGKSVSFQLSDLDDGRTLVELSDGDWAEDDAQLPFCNTYWGNALHNLKAHAEG